MLASMALLAMKAAPAWSQSKLDQVKSDYSAVSSELEKHIVDDYWIDDDPKSPDLLARQWTLAGEWVAAWFNAHPSAGEESLDAAVSELAPTEEPGEHLSLKRDVFLIAAPGPIGNVFIVTKVNGRYLLAWQVQEASGGQAEILAAWSAANARLSRRGADSGPFGSIIPHLARFPDDAKGRPRFYIDGTYAQDAGGTEGKQISLWIWDGVTARPIIARDYAAGINQSVGVRLEGDILKVQQKKFFRTFFSCGMCEERQMDWAVRITPEGVEDLGEKSQVPELDAVDELFYRVIRHQSATDIASPAAVEVARGIVRGARELDSVKEWKEFPSLGMIMGRKVYDAPKGKILCLALDSSGPTLFTLESVGDGFFISDAKGAEQDCEK
ncbi:MAG: hypothetical protein WCB53_04275 [Terriglobales bacterium]